jgi:hypothetical protein
MHVRGLGGKSGRGWEEGLKMYKTKDRNMTKMFVSDVLLFSLG